MSDPVDAIEAENCGEIYDTAGALMAIVTHSPAGGLAGLGTHFAGEYFCNGGTALQPGPPPDYLGGKLGYDPAHDTAPAFATPDAPPADNIYMDVGASAGGFDYAASDSHASDSGFDYTASDSYDGTGGSSSGDSSSSSSSSD